MSQKPSSDNESQSSLNHYEKRNLAQIFLVKNKQGYYEYEGLIFKHHCSKDIHYFKCEWSRRKEGDECKAKFGTKDFDPKTAKEGDQIKVFLLAGHSEQCPTLPTSKNNPENKKKELLDKAQAYTKTKELIISHLEENPQKTSHEITKWMHENMEPHLHLQDIQVQNIVYRHRKEWMITQEAYARINRFNSESLPFLRGNLTLYVKKGNTDVEYKIWIWSSEYQLGKLRLADHIFIDGTFGIVPVGYRQLINIATLDKITGDIIPVCWILSPSKDYQCYKYCLYHFKELVTRSDRLKWTLKYATSDFESGLMKALTEIFPKVRIIGCLFHFKQALWRAAGHMGLKSRQSLQKEDEIIEENEETIFKVTSTLIDQLSKFSWQEKKSLEDYKTGLGLLKKEYQKSPNHLKLIEFYEKNWLKYLVEGVIYYKDLRGNLDRIKTNSVLEDITQSSKQIYPQIQNGKLLLNF